MYLSGFRKAQKKTKARHHSGDQIEMVEERSEAETDGGDDHQSILKNSQHIHLSNNGNSPNSKSKLGTQTSKNSCDWRGLMSKIEKYVNSRAGCCSQAIFWLYGLSLVIYGAVNLALSISSSTMLSDWQDRDSFIFSKETISLWEGNLILSLKVVGSSESCGSGYQEAISYDWPGTYLGCACPLDNQLFILKGACDAQLISLSCYQVDSTDSITISLWRSSNKLCIQRHDTYSFITASTGCAQTPVDSFFQSCGSGETAVCMPVSENCPISYIQSHNNKNVVGIAQEQILEIDSSVSFAFETQSSHYPVAGFRLDEYSHCEHITQKQISLSKKGDYILLKNSRTFCTVSDSRPVQLDTLGEEALFKANAALWSLIMTQKKLPAYPRPSDSYKWVLSSMPYPPWTMSCRATYRYSMPQVKERFELSTEIYNQTHLISTTSISLFVVSLLLIVVSIRRKFIRMADVKYYKAERFFDPRFNSARFGRTLFPREKGWVKTTLIITAVHWIFRFLNLPSIFISLERIKDSIDWFSETLSIQCGDTFYSTNIAGDYKDKLSQLRDFYAVMVGFWWTLFVIDILYAIFTFFYEILPALEEERLTELIVKNTTDKQDLSPEMVGTYKKQIPFPHQQPIIEEEGFDEDQLYDEVKKR